MKTLFRGLSCCLVVSYFACLCSGAIVAAPGDGIAASASKQVNRMLPKVQPPKTTLEFSANPTTQEVSRALVFAEPLFPKVQGEHEGVKGLGCSQLLPVTVGEIQEWKPGVHELKSLKSLMNPLAQKPEGGAR